MIFGVNNAGAFVYLCCGLRQRKLQCRMQIIACRDNGAGTDHRHITRGNIFLEINHALMQHNARQMR